MLKKKIIGIFVMVLFITTVVIPVVGTADVCEAESGAKDIVSSAKRIYSGRFKSDKIEVNRLIPGYLLFLLSGRYNGFVAFTMFGTSDGICEVNGEEMQFNNAYLIGFLGSTYMYGVGRAIYNKIDGFASLIILL